MTGMTCPSCGGDNRDRAKFCDGCGAPLSPAALSPLPGAGADELKHVTVLFSDLEGSTDLIAGHGPEQARQLLLPALRAMSDAVHAFGGTVNQVLGDGVMALFGAPLSQEDHAVRACCAALRMHDLARHLVPPGRLRVGLASGTTLLTTSRGGIGVAGAHRAFGEIIHVASRLQGIAPPGTTLCSADVARLAGAAVDTAPLGTRILRGLPGAQDVHVVRGLNQDGSRFSTALERGLSTFTGRDAEFAALRRLAGLTPGADQDGGPWQGGAAAIVGEAGIGKSRLTWELTQSLDAGAWHVLYAEAVSYGSNIPYLPITRLLRSCFHLGEQDQPEAAADKVSVTLDGMPGLSPVSRSALLSLLDLPLRAGAAEWEALAPLRRRDTLHDAVTHLLQALAGRSRVLVLMEDLHWADEQTLRLVDDAVGAVPGTLLLVTYRPGFEPGWRRLAPDLIPLAPLPPAGMARLAGAVLDGVDPDLRGDVLDRAGGNPFFLEEMARAAARATHGVNGAADGLQAAIPATVQAVLAARIDQLAPGDKEVLQAASALGTRFSAVTLRALFPGDTSAAFGRRLDRLAAAGLLRPPPGPDGEHGFAHALVQEVAYLGLPGGRRRTLHATVAGALERLHPDRLLEQAEPLAYHAHLGEVWAAAALHARRAGQRAASRSAYGNAAAFFEQAIHACEQLPQTPAVLAEHIDIRFELRNALFPTAGIARNLEHSQVAERLARQLGDTRRLAWATCVMSRDLTLAGRPTEAMEAAHRALALKSGDGDLSCMTRCYVALAAYSKGDYPQSAAVMGALVREVEAGDPMRRFGLPNPGAVFFRGWHAWALAQTGAFGAALDATDGMMALTQGTDQPLGVTFTHLSRGFVLAAEGRLPEAEAALRTSLELCRAWDFSWFTNVASCLGIVLCRLGHDAEGMDLLEQAIARTRASGILVSHAQELAWLAEGHLAANRPDLAEQVARDAMEVARAHEERGNEARATLVLACAQQQRGNGAEEVAAHLRTALALAEACGMAPLAAECQGMLGGTLAQTADLRRGADPAGTASTQRRQLLAAQF